MIKTKIKSLPLHFSATLPIFKTTIYYLYKSKLLFLIETGLSNSQFLILELQKQNFLFSKILEVFVLSKKQDVTYTRK